MLMTFVLGDDRDNDYSFPFSLNSRVTKKRLLKLVVKHTHIYDGLKPKQRDGLL